MFGTDATREVEEHKGSRGIFGIVRFSGLIRRHDGIIIYVEKCNAPHMLGGQCRLLDASGKDRVCAWRIYLAVRYFHTCQPSLKIEDGVKRPKLGLRPILLWWHEVDGEVLLGDTEASSAWSDVLQCFGGWDCGKVCCPKNLR